MVYEWGAEDTKKYTAYLKALVTRYHLENRVFFKGTTRNVAKVLVNGDIFVFPSAYEGFGLTMAFLLCFVKWVAAMPQGFCPKGWMGAPASLWTAIHYACPTQDGIFYGIYADVTA